MNSITYNTANVSYTGYTPVTDALEDAGALSLHMQKDFKVLHLTFKAPAVAKLTKIEVIQLANELMMLGKEMGS